MNKHKWRIAGCERNEYGDWNTPNSLKKEALTEILSITEEALNLLEDVEMYGPCITALSEEEWRNTLANIKKFTAGNRVYNRQELLWDKVVEEHKGKELGSVVMVSMLRSVADAVDEIKKDVEKIKNQQS
jgi:hypothetical protein